MRSIPEIKDDLEADFNEGEEHPVYPVSEWQGVVRAGETRQGYWDWVADCIQTTGLE